MPDRYGWLGVARRRQVRDAVAVCMEAWLANWCVRQDAVALELDDISETSDIPSEVEAWRLGGCDGGLSIAIDPTTLGALGCALASVDIAGDGGVAADVGRSAVQDLVVSIASKAGEPHAEAVVCEAPWPGPAARAEFGATRLRAKLGPSGFWISMNREWVDRLCPVRRAPPVTPLSRREASMMPTRVRLTAVLDFGEVDAINLAGLAVDDVLISERRFGHPVEVRTGDETLFGAQVCRDGDHLALIAQNTTTSLEKT